MPWLRTLALSMALVVLSCGGDADDTTGPVATTGSIEIRLAMAGEDTDLDGGQVSVDGGSAHQLTPEGPVTLGQIPSGEHVVTLAGIAGNCTVQGDNPRSLQVSAGSITRTTFQVQCSASLGDLLVSVLTTGQSLDEGGYEVRVDGTHEKALEVNGQVSFAGLAAGPHELLLKGIAANCVLSGDNPRTVEIAGDQTTEELLTVSCNLVPPEAPTGVSASGQAASVIITWTPGVGATSQRVLVEDVAEVEPERQRVIPDGTTATARFDDLTAGRSYRAQVIAVNEAGDAASDPVSFSIADPTPSPLALYPLDGGARDSSGNERHGIVVGAEPTLDRHGHESRALRFDGTEDYVYVANAPWQDLGYFTLVAWVKTEVMTEEYIIARGTTLPYSLRTSGSRFEFRVGSPGGLSATATSTTAVDGRWHQVVGVFDGTTAAVHVDGVREGESPFAGPVATAAHDLEFGRREANTRYFTGSLDDVAIYGQALSAAQIAGLYEQPTVGDIRIQTSTGGHNLDSNGYTLRVEGDSVARLPVNGAVTLTGWQPGSYEFRVEDVAPTCEEETPPSVLIEVEAGELAESEIVITCRSLEGRIAFSHQNAVYVIDADGTDLRFVTEGYDPSWSPDGSKIAFTRGDHVHIVDVSSGMVEPLTEDAGLSSAERPAWSPQGDRIAVFGKGEGWDVYLLPATGGAEAVPLDPQVHWCDTDLTWSPDGAMLALVSCGSEVWTIGVHDGSLTNLGSPRAPDGSLCIYSEQLDWSPDGRLIAVGCSDPGDWEFIYVTSWDGGESWITGDCQLGEYLCAGPEERFPTWAPDGSMLLYSMWDFGGVVPSVQRPEGTGKTPITDMPIPYRPLEYADWIR